MTDPRTPQGDVFDYQNTNFNLQEFPKFPVGGRLSLFAHHWGELTQDRWVLEIVNQGLLIEFARQPPTSTKIIETHLPMGEKSDFLDTEIQNLLSKKAIEIVPVSQKSVTEGFYSKVFLVPKPSGDFRMILNLKNLNKYVKVKKFKMESLRSIIHALDGGLWACKIDLQDAYFHIAVRKPHRQYLRFAFRGTVYQFQTLAFGLTSAPRVFTKVVITLIAFLRQKGIQIHAFLDDWLIVNKDRRNLMQDVEYTLTTLKKLGFLVNHKKSMLSPSQIVEYLGAAFHFNQGFATITEDRWTKIQEHVTVFLKSSTVSAHQFLVLLGIMASCIDLAPLARLHMRPIQLYLLSKWRPGSHDLEKMIQVEKILKDHLIWWTKRKNLFRGQSIQQQSSQKQITLTTDASLWGWGGTPGRSSDRGSMVQGSPEKSHKLARTEGNSAISSPIQRSLDRQNSFGQVRQFNSHSLHQESGGDSISRPVCSSVGHPQVVRPIQDNPKSDSHSREKEHPRRCTVQGKSTTNRVELKSNRSKPNISGVGHPSDRHVRFKAKQQVTSVLRKKSRCKSSNGRCSGSKLAGSISVCISTPDSDPKGASKDSEGALYGDTNSSKLAKTILVSDSCQSPSRRTNTFTSSSRPAITAQISDRTSVSRDTSPNCMEIIQQECIEKGFSESVANRKANSRRGSTIDTYNAKLRVFYSGVINTI